MFEKGDSQMLARKLQELIKNPDFAHQLADNAYNLVMEKYTINAGAKLLNSFLKKIMENNFLYVVLHFLFIIKYKKI